MKKSYWLVICLAIVNLVLLGVLLALALGRSKLATGDVPVLRARALELVDVSGQVRAQLRVEPDGEAVFRLRDENGTIRVKLSASRNGSGLLLLDETTEPGVQIIARRAAAADRPTTTSINLFGQDGQRRIITP
jgi:hypothetical protein